MDICELSPVELPSVLPDARMQDVIRNLLEGGRGGQPPAVDSARRSGGDADTALRAVDGCVPVDTAAAIVTQSTHDDDVSQSLPAQQTRTAVSVSSPSARSDVRELRELCKSVLAGDSAAPETASAYAKMLVAEDVASVADIVLLTADDLVAAGLPRDFAMRLHSAARARTTAGASAGAPVSTDASHTPTTSSPTTTTAAAATTTTRPPATQQPIPPSCASSSEVIMKRFGVGDAPPSPSRDTGIVSSFAKASDAKPSKRRRRKLPPLPKGATERPLWDYYVCVHPPPIIHNNKIHDT